MKMQSLIACALLVWISLPLSGGSAAEGSEEPYAPTYGEWTASRMWGGGYVQNVVLCPSAPKRCYAYIDIGGVSRSNDGGVTWRSLNAALPNDNSLGVRGLSVHPLDADDFVIATGAWFCKTGIYVSRDGGKTFKKTLSVTFDGCDWTRGDGLVLARNPQKPHEILAASIFDGVWKSADDGENWTCLGMKDIWPSDLRYDLENPSRVWLCAQAKKSYLGDCAEGFFRSEDGGATWTKLSPSSPREILQEVANPKRLFAIFTNDVVKRSHVMASTDGGAHWTDFSCGLPQEKLDERYPWSWRVAKQRFGGMASCLGFSLVANANGDFFRLDKGASAWKPVIRKSLDLSSWNDNLHSENTRELRFGKALGSVVIDPNDERHWYLTDWYAVWQTRDAGETWKATTEGMAQVVGLTLKADPFDENTIYLGMMDNGYFRSSDKGGSFKQSLICSDINCIVPDPDVKGLVYACGGHTPHLFLSEDAGFTWKEFNGDGLPDMKTNGVASLAIQPGTSKLFAAVAGVPGEGQGGVYESFDKGRTWKWKGAGLPTDAPRNFGRLPGFFARTFKERAGHELACSANGEMVALSSLSGLVYYWDAKAAAWRESALTLAMAKPADKGQPPCFELVADPFVPGRFALAAGVDGVLLSDDGGRSWRKSLNVRSGSVCFDGRRAGRMAASIDAGVVVSDDSGKSWKLLDPSIPDKHYENKLCFQGGRLVVNSSATGAFWIDLRTARTSPLQ